jgi:hypothetical protein
LISDYQEFFPTTTAGVKQWANFSEEFNIFHTNISWKVNGQFTTPQFSRYISTISDRVDEVLKDVVLSPPFKTHSDLDMSIFGSAAYNIVGKGYRPFDTEVKFLFTFLSDATLMSHSEYRMVLQSKYIVCDSCKQEASTIIKTVNQSEFGATGIPLVMFKVYIQDSTADIQKENFKKFFRIIAPKGIESYLKNIRIPKFSASLEFSASIKIPRDWAIPLDANKEVIPEDTDSSGNLLGTPKALFTFAKSKISFDSEVDKPLGIDET